MVGEKYLWWLNILWEGESESETWLKIKNKTKQKTTHDETWKKIAIMWMPTVRWKYNVQKFQSHPVQLN